MVIDKTLIEDIKSSTNIVDVIGEVVSLNGLVVITSACARSIRKKLPHLTLLRIGSFTIALVVASLAMSSNF